MSLEEPWHFAIADEILFIINLLIIILINDNIIALKVVQHQRMSGNCFGNKETNLYVLRTGSHFRKIRFHFHIHTFFFSFRVGFLFAKKIFFDININIYFAIRTSEIVADFNNYITNM